LTLYRAHVSVYNIYWYIPLLFIFSRVYKGTAFLSYASYALALNWLIKRH